MCVQPDLTFVDILYYDMVAESGEYNVDEGAADLPALRLPLSVVC